MQDGIHIDVRHVEKFKKMEIKARKFVDFSTFLFNKTCNGTNSYFSVFKVKCFVEKLAENML